jgi:hypothetical protein
LRIGRITEAQARDAGGGRLVLLGMRSPLRIALLVALALPAAAAHADADSTIHRHLGLCVRLEVGTGYMRSAASWVAPEGPADVAFAGAFASASVMIGGAVRENLIVGARYSFGGVVNPNVLLDSKQDGLLGGGTLALETLGPEIVYYLMPQNGYLSATLGLSRWSVGGGVSYSAADIGLAGRVAVGKEWWISDHLAIGVNGNAGLARNPAPSPDRVWTTLTMGFAVSATFN